MARAIFSGNIQFGMLNIAVKLFSSHKENSIRFSFLCPEGHKIIYKKFCPICNREIKNEELLKGFYVSKHTGFVIFKQEEIKAIESQSEKVIKIIGFVDNSNIDELTLDKTYYLMPQEAFEKPYFFLKEVLSLTNKSAIGKITMRNKEKLCLIKSYKKGLILITLYAKEDIVDFEEILRNVKQEEISNEEIELGKQLIKLSEVDFVNVVNNYEDGFRKMFKELVKKKLEGQEIKINVENKVVEIKSLVEQLKESIKQKEKKEMVV